MGGTLEFGHGGLARIWFEGKRGRGLGVTSEGHVLESLLGV